jgi:hypothetical protein
MKKFLFAVTLRFYLQISSIDRHGSWIRNFPPPFGGMMVFREAVLRKYFGRDSFAKMIGIVMGSGAIDKKTMVSKSESPRH